MKSTTRQMIKSSWKHILSLVGIISFLLFFLNLLVIISYNTEVFSSEVRQKLGVYLYLDDTEATKDLVYAEAIDMKSLLEKQGMSVDFYSKEDAFKILEERLPNVIENFEKYGIDNPLPPTMYVQFRNEKDYVFLKDVVLEYEDVIKNLDDLENNGFTFSDQERRSANVINLTNVVTQFGYFLVAVIVMIIVAFLLFGLQLTFYRFREQVEVEKLLGSGYFTIQKPFLLITASVLIGAFSLMVAYFTGALGWMNTYVLEVFQVSIYEYALPIDLVPVFLLQEFVILLGICLLFTGWFMRGLIRRV